MTRTRRQTVMLYLQTCQAHEAVWWTLCPLYVVVLTGVIMYHSAMLIGKQVPPLSFFEKDNFQWLSSDLGLLLIAAIGYLSRPNIFRPMTQIKVRIIRKV